MAGVLSSLGLIHPSFRCSLQSTARRRRGTGRREKGRLPEASLLPCRRRLPDNDPGDFHLPPAKDLVTAEPSQASPPLLTSSSSCLQPPPAASCGSTSQEASLGLCNCELSSLHCVGHCHPQTHRPKQSQSWVPVCIWKQAGGFKDSWSLTLHSVDK